MNDVRSNDRIRQLVVTVSAIAMVVGALFGTGLLGQAVEESGGGSLSDQATLVAPDGPAFSIWSVIYAGLIAYTIWQWLPFRATTPRARATGWLAAVSMLLNAAWLLVTQFDWIWASVVVILALVVTLGALAQVMNRTPLTSKRNTAEGVVDRIVVDGTFGLYLGWSSIATVANITAALVNSGVDPDQDVAELWALGVLIVAGLIGIVLALVLRGRLTIGIALSWGLSWIAIGRLNGEPESAMTGITAAIVAAVVLIVTVIVFAMNRRRHTVST